MDRRKFLEWVSQSSLIGLTAGSSTQAFAAFMDHHMPSMLDRDDYTDQPIRFFSDEDRQLVAWIAETIIPSTKTPGSIDARVHIFIELIVRDWMTDEERNEFFDGIKEIDKMALSKNGLPFQQSEEAVRIAILQELENTANGHAWYSPGAASGFETQAPFIAKFKELVVTGFFMSDVGSNHVLRPNIMPGYFEGDVALAPDESAWASKPRV